jgi:peptidoglycan/LPS O-acetylase OafA/YrhL
MTPFRLDGLASGALLALIVRDAKLKMRLRTALPVIIGLSAAALSVVIAVAGTSYLNPVMATVGFSALVLASFALVAYAIVREPAFLRAGFLRGFGKYSYGIYIWHMPLAEVAVTWFHGVAIVAIVGGAAASYGVALISWRLIEKPFFDMKDRFRSNPSPSPHARLTSL